MGVGGGREGVKDAMDVGEDTPNTSVACVGVPSKVELVPPVVFEDGEIVEIPLPP